jgi:glutamyl endopeptidase
MLIGGWASTAQGTAPDDPAVSAEAVRAENTIVSSKGGRYQVQAAAEASSSRPYPGTGVATPKSPSADDPTSAIPARGRPNGGGAGAETVTFPDQRWRISPATNYPARAIVHITFQQLLGGATYACTGFMVGPHTVATAGHCLHQGAGGFLGWHNVGSFRLYPGRDGSSIPYTCPGGATVQAAELWTNQAWMDGFGEVYDYGAITTTCDIGTIVGWYGYLNTQGVNQTGLPNWTQGYPGDKAFGTQWRARNCSTNATFAQCVVRANTLRQLFYRNDTFPGQSGSPAFRFLPSGPHATGIHAYSMHGAPPHYGNNHGTRIQNDVAGFLNYVRTQ